MELFLELKNAKLELKTSHCPIMIMSQGMNMGGIGGQKDY